MATRSSRRKRKKARSNTLDPTQNLHRYANSLPQEDEDDTVLSPRSKKKRIRKSKSPNYRPILPEKTKKRNKSKGRNRSNSNSIPNLNTSIDDMKPRKKKKNRKRTSQTPRHDYVGKSYKLSDDPFNIRSSSDPEPEPQPQDLATLIRSAMDKLSVSAETTRFDITTTFDSFRTILNERETKLLRDVDSTLSKKRSILQTQLEFVEEENNENSTAAENNDVACDPNISLLIERKHIKDTLRFAGWIEGASYANKEEQEAYEKERARRELAKDQFNCVERLKEMTLFERDCNKKREDGVLLNEEMQNEILFINRETKKCEDQLNKARPMLEAARKLVSNIKKPELNEIRSLKKPPAVIELVMTAVALILTEEKPKNWREIKKNLLNDSHFVQNVMQFDTMNFGKKARKECNKVMQHKDFNEERANKASKVAGPLVKWCASQVKYAEILDVVKPMMKKVDKLKKDLEKKQTQLVGNMNNIKRLEVKIGSSRTEIKEMVNHMIDMQNKYDFKEYMELQQDPKMD